MRASPMTEESLDDVYTGKFGAVAAFAGWFLASSIFMFVVISVRGDWESIEDSVSDGAISDGVYSRVEVGVFIIF